MVNFVLLQMDGNGKKVKALREQFEGLQSYCDPLTALESPLVIPDKRRNGIYVSPSASLNPPRDAICFYDDNNNNTPELSSGSSEELESPPEEEGDEEDKSVSSGSNTSALYGRVKRSNAFRQKDVTALSPTSLAPECRYSKGKPVVERVKSLEISGNTNRSSSGGNKSARRAASVCGGVSGRPKQRSPPVGKRKNREDSPSSGKHCDFLNRSSEQKEILLGKLDSGQNCQELSVVMECSGGEYSVRQRKDALLKKLNTSVSGPSKGVDHSMESSYGYSLCKPKLNQNSNNNNNNNNNNISDAKRVENSSPSICAPKREGRLPPEKPPRTFLYDILSDRKTTPTASNEQEKKTANPLSPPRTPTTVIYGQTTQAPNGMFMPPANKRQYSSSSSSSTLTTRSSGFPVGKISTATVRPTNNLTPVGGPKSPGHKSFLSFKGNPKGSYNPGGNRKEFLENKDKGQTHFHPPLVRSKTESQLVFVKKGKNESLGSPSTASGISMDLEDSLQTVDEPDSPFGSCDFYSRDHFRQAQSQLLSHVNPSGGQYRSSSNLLKFQNRFPSSLGLYQSRSETLSSDQGFKISDTINNGLPMVPPRPPPPTIVPSVSVYGATGGEVGGNVLAPMPPRRAFVTPSEDTRSMSDGMLRSKSEWALNHKDGGPIPTFSILNDSKSLVGRSRGEGNCSSSSGHPSLDSYSTGRGPIVFNNSSNNHVQSHHHVQGAGGRIHKPGVHQSVSENLKILFSIIFLTMSLM